MPQSTLQIPETPDKGTMIALQRYNHTKLHHWEMPLPVAQPNFSPEWEEEEGGGLDRGGLDLGWDLSLTFVYSNASLSPPPHPCGSPQ